MNNAFDDNDDGGICEDSIGNFSAINEECSTEIQHENMKLDVSENEDQVTDSKQEMEDFENVNDMSGNSFEKDNSNSNKSKLLNIMDNMDGTEMSEVSVAQVEELCSHSNREEHSSDNDDDKGHTDSDDRECNDNGTDDGEDERYKDIEEESCPSTALLVNSYEMDGDCEFDVSTELTRHKSR